MNFLNEQLYEQHQHQWSRELELDFVKNLVNSPGYRLKTILEDRF